MNGQQHTASTASFESLAPVRAEKILVLPFEDVDVVPRLRTRYPSATITVLTKQDLAGRSLRGLWTAVHSYHPDLAVVSISGSTVNRTAESAELLCGISPGSHRLLRTDAGTWLSVTRGRFWFRFLPRLLWAVMWGVAAVAALEVLSFFMSIKRTRAERDLPSTDSPTLLFLRTDVAGPIQAGGSVSHIKGVLNGFRSLGYRIVYVSDTRLEALPPEVIQETIVPPSALGVFDEFQQAWFNFQLLAKAPALIRKYRPSIIYQRHAILHVAGPALGALAGVPFVLEANASEVWAKRNWSRLFFERLAVRCERVAGEWSQLIVTVSDVAVEKFDPDHRWNDRIVVSPNGVDPEEFHPAIDGNLIRRTHGFESGIVVGFIGTFTKWHGVEALVESALAVVRATSDVYFLLIGDGSLRPELEQRVRKEDFGRRIVFTGLVPHATAPFHLAACEILVAPHLGFEGTERFFGSPTKLFEYMAMGRAIVASNLEQLGMIVHDGVNGLHMRPGSAEDLERAILRLRDDRSLRERLGRQARADAVAQHTWDQNVQRIMDRLRRIEDMRPEKQQDGSAA